MFSKLFRDILRKITFPIGRGIAAAGLSANTMTAIGFAVVLAATAAIVQHHLFLGGVLTIAGGVFDALDGAVARGGDQMSKRGAFLDSSIDRASDALVLGGLAWHFATSGHVLSASWTDRVSMAFVLALVSLVLAFMTSYIRAKAEGLGFECAVGIAERPERIIILSVGLVFASVLFWLLVVLAIASMITVIQRFMHVWKQAKSVPT
ncbi:MAG: CDP-alcohol phosphatidyltransferase family protein [Actinomycetota bacterium]